MRRLYHIIIVSLVFIQLAPGQVNKLGTPLSIRYFEPDEIFGAEQNWTLTQDDRGIIYVGTNDRGILQYDGSMWRAIPVPNNAAVRTLKRGSDGTIYVGAQGDFGFLAPNSSGTLEYVSLLPQVDSARDEIRAIYSLIEWNQKIYFCEYGSMHEYDPSNESINTYILEEFEIPYGRLCFKVFERFFIYEHSSGLFEFNGETFTHIPGSEFFATKFVLSILPYSDSRLLVITHREGAYAFNPYTGVVEKDVIPLLANQYIMDNRFYRGAQLPDGTYAFGTLDAGLIITDTEGTNLSVINKETGLGNEVITNIYFNENQPGATQLWLTLNIGLARVEYFSPFRLFSEAQGLEGWINDIEEYNNTLFIGTRNGVYYLDEDPYGFSRFIRIDGIESQCWSFLVFSPPGTSEKVLWAGTEPDGIFEISKDFKASNIRIANPEIKNDLETFMLYADVSAPEQIFVGTGGGLHIFNYRNGKWEPGVELREMNADIRSIIRDDQGNIWVGTSLRGIGKFDIKEDRDSVLTKYGPDKGLPDHHPNFVYEIGGALYVASPEGIYRYISSTDRFIPDTIFGTSLAGDQDLGVQRISSADSSIFYLSIRDNADKDHANKILQVFKERNEIHINDIPFRRLPSRSADAIHVADKGIIWIGVSDVLYTYQPSNKRRYKESFNTLIRNIQIGQDSILFSGLYSTRDENGRLRILDTQPIEFIPAIKYAQNNLAFEWGCPYFDAEDQIQYSFRLVGFEDNWSRWSDRTEYPYTNLPHGDLRFEVKARNVYGMESEVATYEFSIMPPWYQTVWAYILYFIAAFFLVVMIVRLYTRRLQNEKIRLEGIVARRTAEVVRQKEELEDSITYASRIQRAILPSERVLNEQLPEHFILFKPRDIVSGDFYWMTQKDGRTIIVAADCTGHGVPGAFMSLLGMSFLNEIVNRSTLMKSDEILNLLRTEIMNSLKQTGKDDEAKDGIDLALVIFDREHMKLQYSGAYNPLMLVRPLSDREKKQAQKGDDLDFAPRSIHDAHNVLIQINADKMPIGISAKELKPFTLHELDIKKGHSIYLSSDGFVDQFGGMDGKKFMSRGFKKMILDIQGESMEKQGQILNERFEDWRGELPQVDDILVIGIRFD